MKKGFYMFLLTMIIAGAVSDVWASRNEEITYLVNYGQKVLIKGHRRGVRKWDKACRLKRTSNYIAIVQNDRAHYRIVPVPLGQIVEKMCPKHIFGDALRWLNRLQRTEY